MASADGKLRTSDNNQSASEQSLAATAETDSDNPAASARKADTAESSSEETEGHDTVSVASGSSETGGPDSHPISSDDEDSGMIYHDEIQRGMVIRRGEAVSFVADNLNEQIKLSSPSESAASRSSPRCSVTSDVCPASADSSPVHGSALSEIEADARRLADSVDKMLADIHSTLHTMSAITVGCVQTYRGCVERTLNEIDANTKLMYTFMAKCEQLNGSMGELYKVAEQINDIKRILDMFESDLHQSSP